MKIVGLDLSLASTGVAIIENGRPHLDTITSTPPRTPRDLRTGKPTKPTLGQRADRLVRLRQQIIMATEDADLVVIEGPSLGQARQQGEHDRSGLWWLTIAYLHNSDIPTAEVAPATRIRYALGKGAGKKDIVLAAAITRYLHLVQVTGNDVADALLLASMGARHLGLPIEESLPQANLAALDAVRWPDPPAAAGAA